MKNLKTLKHKMDISKQKKIFGYKKIEFFRKAGFPEKFIPENLWNPIYTDPILVFFGMETVYVPFSPSAGFFRPKTDNFSLPDCQSKNMQKKPKLDQYNCVFMFKNPPLTE